MISLTLKPANMGCCAHLHTGLEDFKTEDDFLDKTENCEY